MNDRLSSSAKVPFREKIGYALGDVASCFFWTTFSTFLIYFYTDVYGIGAAAVERCSGFPGFGTRSTIRSWA